MQTTDLIRPDTVDTALRILSWCVITFAALWLVTAVIGYFHRRAYNLTRAESGRSRNIKPDFLKVDKGKRQAAIERGTAYDAVLEAREPAGAATTVDTVRFWSRLAAMSTASLAAVATLVGTLMKVESIQAGITQLSSWEKFSRLVSENKAGAVVALVVIGSNVVVFVKTRKKKTRESE
jgi:uncharacterized membrane protein